MHLELEFGEPSFTASANTLIQVALDRLKKLPEAGKACKNKTHLLYIAFRLWW